MNDESAVSQLLRPAWVSGGDGKLYINGMLDTPTRAAGAISGCQKAVFGLGAKDAAGTGWNGSLDEVRIYNRALTAGEVGALYQCGGNVGPAGSAGTDRTGGISAPIGLGGTASDDGQPTAMSLAWSKVSGPGAAVFANASAAATSVTCDAAGTYVLRLLAEDGAIATCDLVTVTVSAGTNQAPIITQQASSTYGTLVLP